jgi:hypothetical protein
LPSAPPKALIDLHKKSVGTVTYLNLRYRQTPTGTNKNSPRLWRERVTFVLFPFENWRFSDSRIKANAFYFYILVLLCHRQIIIFSYSIFIVIR